MNSEDKRILEVKIMQILMIEDNESVAEMMQMFFIWICKRIFLF